MNKNYPKPTKNFKTARFDLKKWGYCLLIDSIPKSLNDEVKTRLLEQAEAEKKMGLAFEDGSKNRKWGEFRNKQTSVKLKFGTKEGGINQRVWMLPNKGDEFLKVLKNHKYFKLMKLIVGENPLISSFSANIAKEGGLKMDLHTDQWWAPNPIDRSSDFLPVGSITRTKFDNKINQNITNNDELIARPAVSNVLIMLNGMTKENGGTLVVPGSHLFGRHPDKVLDAQITPIAAEGPPGCAIITDGRLWHGTGANITSNPRLALILTFCGPQYRPQENYTFGLRKDVLKKLNNFQKELLGFKVWNGYGRTGDPTQDFIDQSDLPIGKLKS